MANLIRRNHGYALAPIGTAWDPFRIMREVLGWDAFRDVEPTGSTAELRSFAPRFDVKETKDAYVFRADLPGGEVKDAATPNRVLDGGAGDGLRHAG